MKHSDYSQFRIPTCSVIIVTHNSEAYFHKCMNALQQQTHLPHQIIIVDSGSSNKTYLEPYQNQPAIQVCLVEENIGFCQGNNRGWSELLSETDYVLFLNPDAFLTPLFIEQAIQQMEQESFATVGALTGLLLGYDIHRDQPTGLLDSTGIFRRWYGKWYDRGQGQPYKTGQYEKAENVPAICGALMFCRKEVLDTVLLGPCQVMDPSFYMYKEDIDLSIRLRQREWSLVLVPQLIAYHCRGWQKERSQVAKRWRLLSAQNEMRLYKRLRSPCFLYSALKYFLVKAFNI